MGNTTVRPWQAFLVQLIRGNLSLGGAWPGLFEERVGLLRVREAVYFLLFLWKVGSAAKFFASTLKILIDLD